MTRRQSRRDGRTVYGKSLWAQALGLSQYVFTADRYIESGSNPGFVESNVDWKNAAHLLTQATAAQQAALPSASALFANKLASPFVRASGTRYSSNLAASAWKLANYEVFCLCSHTSATGTQVRYTTRASGNGITQYRLTGGATCFFYADGATIVNVASGGVVGINTATYSDVFFLSPDYAVRTKGTVTASGTQAASPGGNDPEFSLMLGSDGTNHCDMLWLGLWVCLALTAGGRATMQRMIQQTYGVSP